MGENFGMPKKYLLGYNKICVKRIVLPGFPLPVVTEIGKLLQSQDGPNDRTV
jgi:hypothetical protein